MRQPYRRAAGGARDAASNAGEAESEKEMGGIAARIDHEDVMVRCRAGAKRVFLWLGGG